MSSGAKWPLIAVEEFAEVATGGTPSTSVREYWEGGTIPWLNSGELNKGVITDSENFVTEAGLKNSSARMMPENTVLVALTGATTGISALLKIEACANQSVTGVLPSAKHDPAFLLQYLRSIRDRIVSDSWGGAQKHISQGYVKELKIPLPPMAEQQRIAELLDRAEALRAKRRAALAQLDSLTQSLFLDLFGDPAKNPKGMNVEPLGNHLLFVTSGGRGWAQFYASTGSRFIRSLDVQMNQIGNDDIAFVAAPDNAEARRTRVKAGDVLLTITGSRIGRVAPVPEDLKGSFISQHVAILRVDSKCIEPSFLSFFLSFEAGGQRQIAKAQYGQTKPGLNFEQIRRFQIPVPPITLQREFARRVTAVEALKTAGRASLAELDALFSTLQHRAFRGEL